MTALSHFKRGHAIGQSDIRGDCIHFRFYDEYFVVRAPIKTRKIGDFLVAKIADVRKHG